MNSLSGWQIMRDVLNDMQKDPSSAQKHMQVARPSCTSSLLLSSLELSDAKVYEP